MSELRAVAASGRQASRVWVAESRRPLAVVVAATLFEVAMEPVVAAAMKRAATSSEVAAGSRLRDRPIALRS